MSDPKPDTVVTHDVIGQDSGLKVIAYDFVLDHVGDFAIGFLAAVLVIVATEATKPWLKLLFARRLWDEASSKNLLKTMPYVFGLLTSLMFDFSTHFMNLTGVELDIISAIFVGTLITGGTAQLIYHLVQEMQIVKTIQIRWYRFMGVTKEDLTGIRETQQQPTLTPNQIERDKVRRNVQVDETPSVEIDSDYISDEDDAPFFDDDVFGDIDEEEVLLGEFEEDEP